MGTLLNLVDRVALSIGCGGGGGDEGEAVGEGWAEESGFLGPYSR